MSIRKFLLIPLAISVVLFAYYSSEVKSSFETLTDTIHITSGLVACLIVAVILQICGHVVQAYKAKLLLSPIKESSTRFQFRALSIGYLFNAILPFRLGELIRARIISSAMTISFSFALVLIIFERAVDAMLLGLLGLLIIIFIIGTQHRVLIEYASLLIASATLIFAVIGLTVRQNKRMLRMWYRMTRWLNDDLKDSFRFKAWSIIYGLQRSLNRKTLVRYLWLSAASWALYGASIFVIAVYFFPQLSPANHLALSVAPYYGVAVPAGPANLGVFSRATNAFTSYLHLSPHTAIVFNLTAWAVLVIPIASIGLILLFVKTKETLWQTREKQASQNSLMNKLYRNEDISTEMASFLESYFSGNTLSRIVHRLELSEDFRLLKYFKGGSDAITILAAQDGKEIVKKIIPLEFENRLKAQYDWLVQRSGKPGIVKVLGEEKASDHYSIDLAYDPDNAMLFDFMHHSPQARAAQVMDEVWSYMFKHVYDKPKPLNLHAKERTKYINTHIFGCLEKAAAVDAELLHAAEPAILTINGKQYDNLYQVMEKIRKHPEAWKDIATYRETSVVHGDVAVDNILVSSKTGKALLIDPAPDGNIISGPVFDFGKNMQSLYCGYEFMLRDETPVYLQDDTINYRDQKSAQYTRLCSYIRKQVAPNYLSPAEQKSMLFHAGALHIRRLKHQVYYCPANTLKFYAIGVKTLNDFLAQYDPIASK